MEPLPQHLRSRLVPLALAGAVCAVYWRVAGYPFIDLDDNLYVTANPAFREGGPSGIAGILRWAFGSFQAGNWHPLAMLSHRLDVALFGFDAGGPHVVNAGIHLASTLLLYGVLARATGRRPESALAAALFGIHPLHVESVAWVSERKDVLCGLFWILATGAWVRYAERPGARRYLAVALALALALLSKAMAVTLPFALLLLDLWPLGRAGAWPPPASRVARLLAEKIPLLLLSAGAGVLTWLAQAEGSAFSAFPLSMRLANVPVSYARYLAKAAWPAGLSVYYPYPPGPIPAWQWLPAALLLAAASLLAVREAGRRPWLAFGWFWFLGTAVPVIGLVQVGSQAMADRYTYLPLAGIFVAGAFEAGDRVRRGALPVRAAAAGGAALLLATGIAAVRQVGYWNDSVTLFSHALEATEGNWLVHNNLGQVLDRRGRTDEAIPHYREALRLFPDYFEAHFNLGAALLGTDRPEEAEGHFREALRLAPGLPEAENDLGIALARQGKIREAVAHFREALRLRPGHERARRNLETALQAIGGGK